MFCFDAINCKMRSKCFAKSKVQFRHDVSIIKLDRTPIFVDSSLFVYNSMTLKFLSLFL